MVMHSRTPWATKLHPPHEPQVTSDGRRSMLVPTPMLVAKALRRVPRGRLITAAQLRARLARKAHADLTCPLTTGIFLSIIAGASEEALREGRRSTAPWWRVVDDRGRLPPKFPPGQARQARLLREEGRAITSTWQVRDAEKSLLKR